jgi:hypothetical protein
MALVLCSRRAKGGAKIAGGGGEVATLSTGKGSLIRGCQEFAQDVTEPAP